MGFSYLVGFICDYWLENPGPPQVDVLRAAAAVIAARKAFGQAR